MISLTDVVQSSGWKNFMAKLYGIGASVVIIGAMFKINHWSGGAFVITLGLTTEAIIFFFSAFEPLHEELDWTLVYPELAGMSDPDEIENFKESAMLGGDRPIERIEDILSQSGVDNDALKKLGAGFTKLSQTANELSEISQATVATKEFITNLQGAASSVGVINETYETTAQSIKESASNLTNAYFQSADDIVKSGAEVANSYRQIANSIQSEHLTITQGSQAHEQQLEMLNKHLSELNSVYASQIKETSEQMKGSHELYSGLREMIQNLKLSVEETNKYKEEMSKLKDNISSLNSFYGNMLSTVNVGKKK
jgi:gliding motility-associated protein GldL